MLEYSCTISNIGDIVASMSTKQLKIKIEKLLDFRTVLFFNISGV